MPSLLPSSKIIKEPEEEEQRKEDLLKGRLVFVPDSLFPAHVPGQSGAQKWVQFDSEDADLPREPVAPAMLKKDTKTHPSVPIGQGGPTIGAIGAPISSRANHKPVPPSLLSPPVRNPSQGLFFSSVPVAPVVPVVPGPGAPLLPLATNSSALLFPCP